MSYKPLVWFITGSSTGLGRQLVKEILSRDDKVIATARSFNTIKDLKSDNRQVLQLDVTQSMQSIQEVAAKAERAFGGVDVVVNNAGYALLGMTEEIGSDSYHRQFQTNFFGPLNVANAFLPYMRQRRQGEIVFVGSRSSFRTNIPGLGPYSSSKAALTAAAESMATELQSFNIRILNVLPGSLRTDIWSNYSKPTAQKSLPQLSSKCVNRIADYLYHNNRLTKWGESQGGKRTGDPERAAKAIVDYIHNSGQGKTHWPTGGMLVLGEDAEKDIRDKCNKILRNLDETRSVTRSINF